MYVIDVRLLNTREKIMILGLYRRSGRIEKGGIWEKLQTSIKGKDHIVIAGDFNAHHTVWNCAQYKHQWRKIVRRNEKEDLYILNRDTKSRMGEGGRRNFNLDLIFGSSRIMSKMRYNQKDDTENGEIITF